MARRHDWPKHRDRSGIQNSMRSDLGEPPAASDITPEALYLRRREFIKDSVLLVATATGVGGGLLGLMGRGRGTSPGKLFQPQTHRADPKKQKHREIRCIAFPNAHSCLTCTKAKISEPTSETTHFH